MSLTILVVDDDPTICLTLTDYLERSGYGVIVAYDGQQAWDAVEKYRPHLIVTDIRMPQMDGFELIRQVRKQPAFRLLPVIFLTSRAEIHDRIQGYRMGCDLYLPKPFELDELGAVVRNLLDRSQMVRSELHTQSQPIADVRLDLTPREQEVLVLLTEGLSNAQIGDRLHLSPRTIEKYVSKLLQKTETHNRAETVRYALDHHLVDSGGIYGDAGGNLPKSSNVVDLHRHRRADQSHR
ncbi:MAG: response regulator transcription factor [Thermosynechococcaceae cyanobacterium]